MAANARILIADDHMEMARLVGDWLGDEGYATELAASGQEAVAAVRRSTPDLVITDLRMEGVDGLDVLDAARAADPDVAVIIMTAFGNIDSAIEAMKRGAYHYITKPLRLQELMVYVERALAERQLKAENRALRRVALDRAGLGAMVGRSGAMQALYGLCERVAQAHAPVLVRGESGTGKELVARAIHLHGPRKERPFVPINCTALPEQLLESELFGHLRGAFTGATAARRGLLVEADGGTLFLDEIGDMALSLQAKLLRVLEDGEIRAIGSDTVRKVDVRLIAATNRDMEERVRAGQFRADLYYRLNVVPVAIPSLRERREDIPMLLNHFLTRARQRNSYSPVQGIAPDAVAELVRRPWAGNVRELENLIERLVVVSTSSIIELAELQQLAPTPSGGESFLESARTRLLSLRQLEDEYIGWVVSHCSGNKTRAADILGIDVSTIHRRERSGGAAPGAGKKP